MSSGTHGPLISYDPLLITRRAVRLSKKRGNVAVAGRAALCAREGNDRIVWSMLGERAPSDYDKRPGADAIQLQGSGRFTLCLDTVAVIQ